MHVAENLTILLGLSPRRTSFFTTFLNSVESGRNRVVMTDDPNAFLTEKEMGK
jgi:hypothetical protein